MKTPMLCRGSRNTPSHCCHPALMGRNAERCLGCQRAATGQGPRRQKPPDHVIGGIRLALADGYIPALVAEWAAVDLDVVCALGRGEPWPNGAKARLSTDRGKRLSAQYLGIAIEEVEAMVAKGLVMCPGIPSEGRGRHLCPTELTKNKIYKEGRAVTGAKSKQTTYCLECDRIKAVIRAHGVSKPRSHVRGAVFELAKLALDRGAKMTDVVISSGLSPEQVSRLKGAGCHEQTPG